MDGAEDQCDATAQQPVAAAAQQPTRAAGTLAAIFLDVDGVIDSKRVGKVDETKVDRLCRSKV